MRRTVAGALAALALGLAGCASGSSDVISSSMSPRQILDAAATQMDTVEAISLTGDVRDRGMSAGMTMTVDRGGSLRISMADLSDPSAWVRLIQADGSTYVRMSHSFVMSQMGAEAGGAAAADLMSGHWFKLSSSQIKDFGDISAISESMSISELTKEFRSKVTAGATVGRTASIRGIEVVPVHIGGGTTSFATADARLVELVLPGTGRFAVSYPTKPSITAPKGALDFSSVLGGAAATSA